VLIVAWQRILLKQQGYDVVGLFMINWHDTTGTLAGDCPWEEDLMMAKLVAKKLNIPFHSVDLSEFYKKRIVDYMFAEYENGRTPNPDVLCNREIKWDVFVDEAKKLGAEKVATGHYCQVEEVSKNNPSEYRLLAGADRNKDQSYFLCQVTQQQLSVAMFPIGHLQKGEVRKMAEELDLATADRKDSQGLCFIRKIDLPTFLQQQLEAKAGDVVEIPKQHGIYEAREALSLEEAANGIRYTKSMEKVIGRHNGAHFYTIGQRKGINIGGKEEPLFVIGTDVKENVVYTGQGHDHPGLNKNSLFISASDVHWVRESFQLKENEECEYQVRIRYRQPLQEATLIMKKQGLYINFKDLQRGITPGQFAAWYKNNELIGSGVIM
jgi:tRNA-specific 2-thiouridylase